ncbi:MAG: helix-turn-helix domain-containing protein [Clostridiales bacterium]|nr:helix-turn-helix domain-containing protein [Clostridiales bacterium]
MIDYIPLWNTLEREGISQYRLLEDKVIDNKTLDGLKHGRNITLLTLERLCRYLKCTPNDIVRFVDD